MLLVVFSLNITGVKLLWTFSGNSTSVCIRRPGATTFHVFSDTRQYSSLMSSHVYMCILIVYVKADVHVRLQVHTYAFMYVHAHVLIIGVRILLRTRGHDVVYGCHTEGLHTWCICPHVPIGEYSYVRASEMHDCIYSAWTASSGCRSRHKCVRMPFPSAWATRQRAKRWS